MCVRGFEFGRSSWVTGRLELLMNLCGTCVCESAFCGNFERGDICKNRNGCVQWTDTGWDWPSVSVVRVALCISRSVYSQVELLRGWNR